MSIRYLLPMADVNDRMSLITLTIPAGDLDSAKIGRCEFYRQQFPEEMPNRIVKAKPMAFRDFLRELRDTYGQEFMKLIRSRLRTFRKRHFPKP